MAEPLEVSVVIPCLNEANSIGVCVEKARGALRAAELRGEVVVADNGSTDGSAEIAAGMGARGSRLPERIWAGAETARGACIVMGDADDSYGFAEVPGFFAEWRRGGIGCTCSRAYSSWITSMGTSRAAARAG